MTQQTGLEVKITQAFVYFNEELGEKLQPKVLEKHLIAIEIGVEYEVLVEKTIAPLTKRFYDLTKLSIVLEEYLFLRFTNVLCAFYQRAKPEMLTVESGIICLWACISHLKEGPHASAKPVIKAIIYLMQTLIHSLLPLKQFKISIVFPQVYSLILNYILKPSTIDHSIYQASFQLLTDLLATALSNVPQVPYINKKGQKTFYQQCWDRLNLHTRQLISQIPYLQPSYIKALSTFLTKVETILLSQSKLVGTYGMLCYLTEKQLKKENVRAGGMRIIEGQVNTYVMDSLKGNIKWDSPNHMLKAFVKLSPYFFPTSDEDIGSVYQLMMKKMFSISGGKQLVRLNSTQTTPLAPLSKQNDFVNYGVQASTLLESFDAEVERVLVMDLSFVEGNLENVRLLKQWMTHMNNQTVNKLLMEIVSSLMKDEQYDVNMSLVSFYRYLGKVTVIYWLVSNGQYVMDEAVCRSLFDYFSNSEGVKVLKPSFEEEQLMISMTIRICSIAYHQLVKHNISPLLKLKYQLSLLQLTLNNLSHRSFIIQLITIHTMLIVAAPKTVGDLLTTLHSTIIDRNIHNVDMVAILLRLCQLNQKQCENLCDRFLVISNSEAVLTSLMPHLSPAYQRNCLLTVQNWPQLLYDSIDLLHQQPLTSSVEKKQWFAMNDADNVVITNALGVIILELGNKWEIGLTSRHRERILDVMVKMAEINPEMVFFKRRFNSILESLIKLLEEFTESDTLFQRSLNKIFSILASLPKQYFSTWLKPSKPLLHEIVQKHHEKIKYQYFLDTKPKEITRTLYDQTQKLMEKLETS